MYFYIDFCHLPVDAFRYKNELRDSDYSTLLSMPN